LSNGETPSIAEAYDPKSLEHIILAGTYPGKDMVVEMDAFLRSTSKKYNVTILDLN
jgi:hypothetical protein